MVVIDLRRERLLRLAPGPDEGARFLDDDRSNA